MDRWPLVVVCDWVFFVRWCCWIEAEFGECVLGTWVADGPLEADLLFCPSKW